VNDWSRTRSVTLLAVAVMVASQFSVTRTAVAAATATAAQARATDASVDYVFASELGSGVYDVAGRTLQVYRLPFSYQLRAPREQMPGIRLVAPVTVGFFDFQPEDVLENGLPSRIDSFSFMPGIELLYATRSGWLYIPYGKLGLSVASGNLDSVLYSLGLRRERERDAGEWKLFLQNEISFAGASFRNDRSNDYFARLRVAAEFRHTFGKPRPTWQPEFGFYAIADVIGDPPTLPLAGAQKQPLQLELGVMFGTRPEWRVWRVPVPRLGIGYRIAGDFSGWRLAFGGPF
jgi:hypothetical protein